MTNKTEIDQAVLYRILDDAAYIKQEDRQAIRAALATCSEDVQPPVGDEPVVLQHMAYAENGILRWISGRKMHDCELYASLDRGVIRGNLYRRLQRPVVFPARRELSPTGRVYLSDLDCEWNACIDEFKRLNP